MTTKKIIVLAFVAVFAGRIERSSFAQAEKGGSSAGEVRLSVKPQDPTSKTRYDAPMIRATVIGGQNVPLDKFTLVEPGSKVPFALKAMQKQEYNQGSDTIAIALVINGSETWIGNDDIEPEESPSRYLGVLKGLKTALQNVPFATAGPAGSLGVLITYGDTAEVKLPTGPLASLTGEALGTQKDYYKKTGNAMVQGIDRALAELHSVQASRKAMIVVCDGNDTNNDAAKAQLKTFKDQAKKDGIDTFAIIYKGQLSDQANTITAMIQSPKTVNSAEDIATSIKSILERMADRYYLTFPGYDKTTKTGLQWDGKVHELQLKIDKDFFPAEGETAQVTLAPVWSPPQPRSLWWLAIVIPLLVIILLVVAVKLFGGKKAEPMPMPMPVMAQAAPVGEAPKPAGPQKTVMFSVGGTEEGFPLVGWLVPLNGPNAFQTMRLRSGQTKIGTQPPSDLVVNDGFMSTEHCQIVGSPQGYSLVDGGSTNGSYVNDKKVSKHELVDNDVITLGKTNFKFKSIS